MQAAAARPGDPALATRLRGEIEGEVLFDAFSRGRYSTDASIYQIEPLGVVVPRSEQDLVATGLRNLAFLELEPPGTALRQHHRLHGCHLTVRPPSGSSRHGDTIAPFARISASIRNPWIPAP